MYAMSGTIQPSIYLCPECVSEATFEDPMNDVFFCKTCGFHASIEVAARARCGPEENEIA
jgi:predicted amidophosphoribosyltransferase